MKEKLLVPVAYFIVCFFWGSSWLAIQVSLKSIPPFFNAGFRFLTATLLIGIIIKIMKYPLHFDKASVRIYLLMGFISFSIPFSLVYWAEERIPSSLASILFGLYPFVVAIFSAIMLKSERFSYLKIGGITLAFAGLVLIFSEGLRIDLEHYFTGMLAVVISATLQGFVAVYLKKYAGHLNPLSMNFIPLGIASIVLILTGLVTEGISSIHGDIKAFLLILYLAVFATIFTFTAYYWLMKRVNVVILSLTSFITPIVAIILGWLLNNEKLTGMVLGGTAMILSGIILVNLRGFIGMIRK